MVMVADPGDPREAWGVLNPASARRRDGELYLFPRLVAAGNYSRVGRARVVVDDAGDPVGVERPGVALEPEEGWERHARTSGVEEPRITFVPSLDVYVLTYSAYGPLGRGSAWRSRTTWSAGSGWVPRGSPTSPACGPT